MFNDLKSLHYLQKGVDINFCDISTDFYYLDDPNFPDMTSNNATMNLVSRTKALKPITVQMSILENEIVSIHWTYRNPQDVKQAPFEVP